MSEALRLFPVPRLSTIVDYFYLEKRGESSSLHNRVLYLPGDKELPFRDRLFEYVVYSVEVIAGFALFDFAVAFISTSVMMLPVTLLFAPFGLIGSALFLHGGWNGIMTIRDYFFRHMESVTSPNMAPYYAKYGEIKNLSETEIKNLMRTTLGISEDQIGLAIWRTINSAAPYSKMTKLLAQILVKMAHYEEALDSCSEPRGLSGLPYIEQQWYLKTTNRIFVERVINEKIEIAYLIALLKNPKLELSRQEIGKTREEFYCSPHLGSYFNRQGENEYFFFEEANRAPLKEREVVELSLAELATRLLG